MQYIVAYIEHGQAYVLPAATADNGLAVLSQPKFIREQDALGLRRLNWSTIQEEWAKRYLEIGYMDQVMRQRLYVWWMSLTSNDKLRIFEQFI